ncbi:MAG: IclR family transcriptional regulator C-terminal domain-containing protein, partial [Novosphingobium sp.]
LAQEFGVTVLGVQIFGLDHIVAVGVARGSTGFQLATEVGSRFPALISATGRCIAAFGTHGEARLKARFAGLRWDNPPSFDEWMAQVAQTRAQGFGIDEGNYIAGVTVLAAPVWQAPGSPGHALVAIGLSAALERAGLPQLQAALLDAAQTLTRRMGGSG